MKNNMHHKYQLNALKKMNLYTIKSIVICCCVIFMTEIHAQKFDIESLKAKAEWGFMGNNKLIFESHHMRVIARYDSFTPAILNLFEDCKASNLNFDSLPSPLQMHYILFKDGKRKLTIENPEFTQKEFDIENEIANNEAKLSSNCVEIHDLKHQINIKIYLEHPSKMAVLQKMAQQFKDSIFILSSNEIVNLKFKLYDQPNLYFSNLYLHYFMFCKGLKEFEEPDQNLHSYQFFNQHYSYEFNSETLKGKTKATYMVPFETNLWLHQGIGFMEKNTCIQTNLEFSLYTHYRNDLPLYKLYTNLGIFGFIEQKDNNNQESKINGFYETLLGIKFNNINPKMKSASELRVTGLELGTYFKTEKSASTLLPSSGFAWKIYRQFGNIRINTGVYWCKTSIAGLFTLEIYDILQRIGQKE